MVGGKTLFIEGTTDESNGDLAEGFKVLLEQQLKGSMPKIIMGNGKSETIDKFKNRRLEEKRNIKINRFLLVDLDNSAEYKEADIDNCELGRFADRSFYMIQEMESWFISQSETVIDIHYKSAISEKIVKKGAMEFSHPDEEIGRLIKPLGKEYHKVKDGVRMLKLLNLRKLMQDFPDVKSLVEELQKAQ